MSNLTRLNMFNSSDPRFPAGSATTKDGLDWLTCVTDPYHDFNLRIAGVPAKDASMSYMRQFKERVVIDNAGIAGAFDVHVFMTNILGNAHAAAGIRANSNVSLYQAHLSLGQLGFITYVVVPAGQTIYSAAANWRCIDIQPGTTTPYRVSSAGFEVHNTTPELYVSGSATVWRGNPQNHQEVVVSSAGYVNLDGAADSMPFSADYTAGMAGSLALANMLPNSRTWKAREGALVVGQPNFEELHYQRQIPGPAFLEVETNDVAANYVSAIEGTSDAFTFDKPGMHGYHFPSGYTPCGVIFAGLSNETTLSLDVRVFVESAPSSDAGKLALCSPAATYDPVAIATAARLFSLLPPGTEVKNNDLGRWFRNILSLASKVLPMVAAAVPHPVAKAALGAAAAAAGAAHGVLGPRATASTVQATAGRMAERPATAKQLRKLAKG